MALTQKQIDGVIKLFVRTFVDCKSEEERKILCINFEDTFGNGILDWKEKCKELLVEYKTDEKIIGKFDEISNRKQTKTERLEYSIRLLEEKDFVQVRELINHAFDLGLTIYDDDRMKEFIQAGYSIVAHREDEILGVLMAYETPELVISNIYIDTFTVAESVRGCGMGEKMIEYVQGIARGKEKRVYTLRLQTNKKIDAYQIYKHWGFQEMDRVVMKQYFY